MAKLRLDVIIQKKVWRGGDGTDNDKGGSLSNGFLL